MNSFNKNKSKEIKKRNKSNPLNKEDRNNNTFNTCNVNKNNYNKYINDNKENQEQNIESYRYTSLNINKKNNYLKINENNNEVFHNNKYNSISHIVRNKKILSASFLNINNINIKSKKNKNYKINLKSIKINNKIDNDDIILNYEIEKLQKEINIQKDINASLIKKLNEEKNRNLIISENNENKKNIEQALLELCKYIEVPKFEEILPKLEEMINYINKYKNEVNEDKNEFLLNLKKIYKKNNVKEKEDKINMKLIWKWIKYLINENKSLNNQISKNSKILESIEKENINYKDYCSEIMSIYNFKELNQFDKYIHELINKSNFNKKRIDQLKKILVEDDKNNNNEKNLK